MGSPVTNTSSPPRAPQPHDAVGAGPGALGYSAAAPTRPHLGWTDSQVNARTGGAGRPLAEVRGSIEQTYKVPQRGLSGIPDALLSDSNVRIEKYNKPLANVEQRFAVTDASKVQDPQAWRENARAASDYRNSTMQSARDAMSPQGQSASQAAKPAGKAFESAWAGAERSMKAENPAVFEGMSAAQRDVAISKQVIKGAGKADPTFNALVQGADEAALGLKAMKYGGRALAVVGAVADGVSIVGEARESMKTGDWTNTGRQTAKVAGGWLGAAATGAAVGAVSGTIVPGLGNVAGFVIGAAAGAVGYWLGSQGGEAAFNAAAGT